jgi:hypothetical protein
MSRKPYECFRCRDNGFPNTQVYLAGKDEQGKTVYVEDDGTTHQHKMKHEQQPKQQQLQEKEQTSSSLYQVSDESVQRGITAFSMMTNLILLVEQTQKLLVTMDGKLDRLLLNLAERKQ